MTPEQFCYWLQGRAELQPTNPPSAEEWKMIADHLQLVFKKETLPIRLPVDSSYQQRAFQQSLGQVINQMPQCGTSSSMQYGRNPPNIC